MAVPPQDNQSSALAALGEAHAAHGRGAAPPAVFGPLLQALLRLSGGRTALLVLAHRDGARLLAQAGDPADAALEDAARRGDASAPLLRLPLLHRERVLGAVVLSGGAVPEGPAWAPLLACAASLLHTFRQAEEHEESEARRSFYQIAAHDGRFLMWEWEAHSDRVRYASGETRRRGRGPEWREVPVSKLEQVVHPEDLPALLASLREQKDRAPKPYQTLTRIFYPDGSLRWFESQAMLTRDEHGRAQRLVGVALDVTERKQLESSLLFRSTVLEHLRSAVLVTNMDRRMTYVNPHAEEMYGWRSDELIGTDPFRLVPEELQGQARELSEHIRQKGRWDGEFVGLRRDGTTFPYLCSASMVRDAEGRPLGLLQLATDISQQKRDQERLQAALRERDTLLRELHHRVKNNLQIISSLLHLQMGRSKSARLRELLRDSQVRIRSMSLLHESLYRSPDLGDVDVAQYVRALVSSIAQSYLGRGQRIEVSVDVAPISVGLDAAIQLGLVVNELVVNAFKHGLAGRQAGVVGVRLGRCGDEIVLSVEDDGVGPPPGLDPAHTPTIGLQLVTSLVGQLQGSFRLARGERTVCEARVPAEARGDRGV